VRRSPPHPWATLAASARSTSGGPRQAQGAGDRDRYAPWRARTPWMQPGRARLAVASQAGPGRRQAHPRPSLSVGSPAPARKPRGVCAWQRRHGPPDGPARCRLGLGQFFAPNEISPMWANSVWPSPPKGSMLDGRQRSSTFAGRRSTPSAARGGQGPTRKAGATSVMKRSSCSKFHAGRKVGI